MNSVQIEAPEELQCFTFAESEISAAAAWLRACFAGENEQDNLNHKQELVTMLKPHLVVWIQSEHPAQPRHLMTAISCRAHARLLKLDMAHVGLCASIWRITSTNSGTGSELSSLLEQAHIVNQSQASVKQCFNWQATRGFDSDAYKFAQCALHLYYRWACQKPS